jgi:hypothetical protein
MIVGKLTGLSAEKSDKSRPETPIASLFYEAFMDSNWEMHHTTDIEIRALAMLEKF